MTSALRDTVRFATERAASDDLLPTLICADARETFLPLYTSDGVPLVSYISSWMASAFSVRWPHLDDQRLHTAMAAVTRLVTATSCCPSGRPSRPANRSPIYSPTSAKDNRDTSVAHATWLASIP